MGCGQASTASSSTCCARSSPLPPRRGLCTVAHDHRGGRRGRREGAAASVGGTGSRVGGPGRGPGQQREGRDGDSHPQRGCDSGEIVNCAVLTDKGATRALGALLDSLSAHATRPLHVWLIGPAETGAPLARRFPEITVSSIPGRPLGPSGRRLRRVLLPSLVPEVARLVVLPLPAVVTADVAELADLDLGRHAIAAPRRLNATAISGFGVVNSAANRRATSRRGRTSCAGRR